MSGSAGLWWGAVGSNGSHFTDACASLWVDGELVHLEELVLHDAGYDIRVPTHELTIARDALRARRRIAANPPGRALGADVPAVAPSIRSFARRRKFS